MEVVQIIGMNKGTGEGSYARNCALQEEIISRAKSVIEETIMKMLSKNVPQSIGIADLGCSSGPNTLLVISGIIDIIHAKCQNLPTLLPEFRVFLNDLPCNDFNSVFGLLPAFYRKLNEDKGPEFGPCFVSAMPGSFYSRLFPAKSLHCVHSSSSLHWLSQAPPNLGSMNKGKLYISKTSPQCVLDSYFLQFQKDFSSFLISRSKEIVPGGCMVLSFMGRSSPDPTIADGGQLWELLSNALMSMVHDGMVEEEKVDSFDAPYYAPSAEELYSEVKKEGSFVVNGIESFGLEWDGGSSPLSNLSRGRRVAKSVRVVLESMLESHFGKNIMDELFSRYADFIDDYLSKIETKYTVFIVSLVRKDQSKTEQIALGRDGNKMRRENDCSPCSKCLNI